MGRDSWHAVSLLPFSRKVKFVKNKTAWNFPKKAAVLVSATD